MSQLKAQWISPNDILSILLLLGPDVIQRALAQAVGRRVTPVAFSFGWVTYAVNALLSALGDRRLMPPPDFKCIVVGAKSGHSRNNKSWVIGRILRDYEQHAPPHTQDKNSSSWEALRVSIFRIKDNSKTGIPANDLVWFSGFGVVFVQIMIAIVPLYLHREWMVLLLTFCGTLLAFSNGLLSQWCQEKWDCPKRGGEDVTITQGNGSRHAIVVLGGENSPDLEILSYSDGSMTSSLSTRVVVSLQAVLWVLVVITVAGLKQGGWYLLSVGTAGMLQNMFVAGSPRQPQAHGFHLEHINTVSDNRVCKVLARLESLYPFVGSSLLPVFYPAGFKAPSYQENFWKEAELTRCKKIAELSEAIAENAECHVKPTQVDSNTRPTPISHLETLGSIQTDRNLQAAKRHNTGDIGCSESNFHEDTTRRLEKKA
ncbi:MAG: hypothetical protein Q9224_005250 [Gallowayella concinna]